MLSIAGVEIQIGTQVFFLFPFTSRTILNLFPHMKLVVCLFEFICSCIFVTNLLMKTKLTRELDLKCKLKC